MKWTMSLLRIIFADQMTRIEFEADLLKDEKIEREEEVRSEIVAKKVTKSLPGISTQDP